MQPEDEVIRARLGSRIGGKWTLERLIGVGGMAAVYAARDAQGNEAALKLLHPEMSRRQDVRERFLREGLVANRISHPGAVRVIEHGGAGAGDEQAYLVMELLKGEPLNERFRRAGKLPVPEVFRTLDEVLEVLALAHDSGIIHRDLKPDNLFVTESGQVKVLDFGLARLLDSVPGEFQTKTGIALGTLPYMAPEQALGKRAEIDGRVDLFALGASAFRLLSGRKVHEADSEAELLMAMASKPAPALASVAADVPHAACAVIDLSLAFSRDARYPHARAMQEDVRAVLAGKAPPFATRRAAAREQATAVNLPAVVLPPASVPSAAVSQRAIPDRPIDPTLPDAASPASAAAPDLAPPSSQPSSMTLDLGPRSVRASTAGPTLPMPAVGPASAAPSVKRSRSPVWIVAALAALAGLIAAALYAFTGSDADRELPSPIANSADNTQSEPATELPADRSRTSPSTVGRTAAPSVFRASPGPVATAPAPVATAALAPPVVPPPSGPPGHTKSKGHGHH